MINIQKLRDFNFSASAPPSPHCWNDEDTIDFTVWCGIQTPSRDTTGLHFFLPVTLFTTAWTSPSNMEDIFFTSLLADEGFQIYASVNNNVYSAYTLWFQRMSSAI